MPDQFKPLDVTTHNGKKFTVSNAMELESLSEQLEQAGYKPGQVKFSEAIPERKTDWLDRMAGAAGGAALGTPGGLPGMAIGGAIGAAMPPRTLGDWGADIVGSLTGGPVGKMIGKLSTAAPKVSGITRSLGGLGQAEIGHATKSVIDEGKLSGFNPASLEGVTSMVLPNAANSISRGVQNSAPVANQKLREMFPSIMTQKSNSEVARQAMTGGKKKIPDKAITLAGPAQQVIKQVEEVELGPYQNIVKSYEGDRSTLIQQLDALKQSKGSGVFSAADNLKKRIELEDEISKIDDKINNYSAQLVQAERAAISNNLALKRASKTSPKGMLEKDKQVELDGTIPKIQLVKEKWEESYLQEQKSILDKRLDPRNQKIELDFLNNKYKQIYNNFDQDIGKLKVDKKVLTPEILAAQRKFSTPEQNLATNAKFQAELKEKTKLAEIEKKKLNDQLGVPEVKDSLKYFNDAFSNQAVLPRPIKDLVGNSGDMDKFVNTFKNLRSQEVAEVMKFIPPAQQDKFKKSMGDAVIFDFFTRAYDPKTKLFSNAGAYVEKYGLPNLEFFTGSPDAQKKFQELTSTLINYGETQQKFGGPLINYLKAATIKGFAFSGLTALFGTSQLHTGNAGLSAAAAGAGALAVAIPSVISHSMKNPKLASDFIKFVESGGTYSYAQLPYLSAFLKKEGKPVNEEELAKKDKLTEDLINSYTPDQPQQQAQQPQTQGQPQGQQSQLSPGQGPPTPEQIEIMKSMALARAQQQGQQPNQQGQQAVASPVQTQPQVSLPQPNQQPQ